MAFSRVLCLRTPISQLMVANDVFSQWETLPSPFMKAVISGCSQLPVGDLLFFPVLLSRASSEIRGNLTSQSGSTKESYFRHSSMNYLDRQSCSIPCMLQGLFQAHDFGCSSARGCLPGAVVCSPAPPQSTHPGHCWQSPLQKTLSKKLRPVV